MDRLLRLGGKYFGFPVIFEQFLPILHRCHVYCTLLHKFRSAITAKTS